MVNNYLYYILQWTWGLPLNIVGLMVYIICKYIFKYECEKHRKAIWINIPTNNWGVNLGMFLIGPRETVAHEYGHSIQNLIFGPFMIIIVAIPSAIRFWYRRIIIKLNKTLKTRYDDIWFEGSATKLGREAGMNKWKWM